MPEKKFENKNKKNIFCRVSELALDKGTSLPSARPDTRQRQHVCRVLMASTRQRMTEGPPPASPEVFCRGLFFAECLTLGKEDVCRVSLFAECLALGKDGLCRVPALPSAALGKLPLCRVLVFRHSAKRRALGKERVSRSEGSHYYIRP